MTKFVVRKLLIMAITVFFISMAVFFIIGSLVIIIIFAILISQVANKYLKKTMVDGPIQKEKDI